MHGNAHRTLVSCQERDKMIAGKPYRAADPILSEERLRSWRACREFNELAPDALDEQKEALRRLLGETVQDKFFITQPFFCDYGYNIILGEDVYMNTNCCILDCSSVSIGKNTKLGPHVQIYTATHPIDPVERTSGLEGAKAISIGDDCWIGGGVIICPGVQIGNGVTIGAGSVVTKNIPDYVVAVGNPARVIKKLDQGKDT